MLASTKPHKNAPCPGKLIRRSRALFDAVVLLYYFQIKCTKMRREFFILANVNETQRSSATLSGMSGRQKGKGASRWCS